MLLPKLLRALNCSLLHAPTVAPYITLPTANTAALSRRLQQPCAPRRPTLGASSTSSKPLKHYTSSSSFEHSAANMHTCSGSMQHWQSVPSCSTFHQRSQWAKTRIGCQHAHQQQQKQQQQQLLQQVAVHHRLISSSCCHSQPSPVSSFAPQSTCLILGRSSCYHSSSLRPSSHTCSAHIAPASSSSSSSSTSRGNGSPRPPSVDEISSTANPYIKHCVKLRESARYRQQQRRLLLVGSTLLSELAEEASTSLEVLVLFVRAGAALPPGVSAQRAITVTDPVMKKITGLEEAAGVQVVAELALPEYVDISNWRQQQQQPGSSQAATPEAEQQGGAGLTGKQQQQHSPVSGQLQRLLVLEGVQDPGNLGTLLRCSAAFGWDAVWLLPGCCDPFNDKAVRASRGAALRVPLAAGSLQDLLAVVQQQGLLLLAAHPEDPQQQQQQLVAEPDYTRDPQYPATAQGVGTSGLAAASSTSSSSSGCIMQQPVCLVLGTEGAGLSDDVLAVATPLSVPMSKRMESLNVGVAGSILMFALSEGAPLLLSRLQQLGQQQQKY